MTGRGTRGHVPVIVGAALLVLAASVVAHAQEPGTTPAPEYDKASAGTRVLSSESGLVIKMLLEASNLGGDELEIGEITFPAGTRDDGHVHGAMEIFYVLSGRLEHVVNGDSYLLEPGMVGVVRQGDTVAHRVPGTEPCRALVIWVPGGEADRLARFFDVRPLR